MKKIKLFVGIFIVSILSLSGCQNIKSETEANLLKNHPPIQVRNAYVNQGKIFDDAYSQAPTSFSPDQVIGGAIISANFSEKKELAGFFQQLEKHQQYDTIVVLGSTDFQLPVKQILNSTIPQSAPLAYFSATSLKTPYGILKTADDIVQKLGQNPNFSLQENIFTKNDSFNMLAPFLNKSFPNATYLPLMISDKSSEIERRQIAITLQSLLGQRTLVLAQTQLKTFADPLVADFQLKFTQNVLGNFDKSALSKLPLEKTAAVEVLQNYLTLQNFQKAQPEFWHNEQPAFIEYFLEGNIIKNRSSFVVSFGDIMLGRNVRTLMDRSSLDYPFEHMDKGYLEFNDLLIANLEGPIAKKAIQTSKEIAFRFMEDTALLLKKYFFDVLSLANNHAFDMGTEGYQNSRELLQAQGILAFGNPKTINDESIATTEIQGQKIAFLGLDDVDFKIDQTSAVNRIKELTHEGYKVIPFVHWGIEYVHAPNKRQVDLAHAFIDAGATMVIACHPHVVQTFETYKNKPIFYSLGNAIFDQYFSADTEEGLSVALIISSNDIQVYFLPIKIDHSQMRLMNAEERKIFLERFVTYGTYSEEEKKEILSGKMSLI